VIVVGGGLAGLSAAYCLAKEGIGVLVVERAIIPAPRYYRRQVVPESHPKLLPDIIEQAPLERFVTKNAS